jgi:hypothetical protein
MNMHERDSSPSSDHDPSNMNVVSICTAISTNGLREYAQMQLLYQQIFGLVEQGPDSFDKALQLIKQNEHVPWNQCETERDEILECTLLGYVITKEDAGPLTNEILKWKIDASKHRYYYSNALLCAVYCKRPKIAKILCEHPELTIDDLNETYYEGSGDRIMHLAVRRKMKSFVKLMIPRIIDGLDLFLFNSKDETAFDEIDKFQKPSFTARYMNAAIRVWNAVGNEINHLFDM